MRKFIIIYEAFPSSLFPPYCFFPSHRQSPDVHRSLPVSCVHPHMYLYISGGSGGKESAHSAGDPSLIPGLGRSPGEGNGNPLQYSCLGNPKDRGAWWVAVHGIAKSWTQLKWLSTHEHIMPVLSLKRWYRYRYALALARSFRFIPSQKSVDMPL